MNPGFLLKPTTLIVEQASYYTPVYKEVLQRFTSSLKSVISTPSHWRISNLHDNYENLKEWNRIKTQVLILGVKKSIFVRNNGRSTDFIAPSHANGCASSCIYCYNSRRKGFSNPITTFTNTDASLAHLATHIQTIGRKCVPNQCDDTLWTYDIGENNDCSIDDLICSNVKQFIEFFSRLTTAKASFATKHVNRRLLTYDPKKRTRVRFSVMPFELSKKVDVRTALVKDRILAANDFVEAGYEVHFNFSPVIHTENWLSEWEALFAFMEEVLSPKVKEQAACEIIFLTHNADLHQKNLVWYPEGEKLIWNPQLQENKISQNHMKNLRYKSYVKRGWINQLLELKDKVIPWCKTRYSF